MPLVWLSRHKQVVVCWAALTSIWEKQQVMTHDRCRDVFEEGLSFFNESEPLVHTPMFVLFFLYNNSNSSLLTFHHIIISLNSDITQACYLTLGTTVRIILFSTTEYTPGANFIELLKHKI